MKMKFWQKAYIFTLVLFLLCLNTGILTLAAYTDQKNEDAARASATAQQDYLVRSFERDYTDLLESDGPVALSVLAHSYGEHYKQSGIYIAIISDGEILYSNVPKNRLPEKSGLFYEKIDKKLHIYITDEVFDGNYELIFVKDVSSLSEKAAMLTVICVIVGLAMSTVLAICLYFILKKLSKPLDELKNATSRVENGDFSVTAKVIGNDEFADLAEGFNAMIAKINEQMEGLETDAKMKQTLIDDMAHELRTPLTSIRGYGEVLEMAATSEETRIMAAKHIVSEAKRLEKISQILLDSAFIRENPPKTEPVNVGKLLLDTAQSLEFKARESGVDICARGCESTENIIGNETLLSMLAYNLTENAIKACEKGGMVELVCLDRAFEIRDNGRGIEKEMLDRITTAFFRTDKSRSRADGGAGLGLYLCQRIADIHGATMKFTSEVGKGTTVRVDFTT